jgi:hypothetical protein
VALYTLVAKVPGGEIRDDWAHTLLHLASGAFAVYAGWIAASPTAAGALTWALAIGYGALGVAGWFLDGFLLDTTLRVPLGAADNIFHLVIGVGALVAIVASRSRDKPATKASS